MKKTVLAIATSLLVLLSVTSIATVAYADSSCGCSDCPGNADNNNNGDTNQQGSGNTDGSAEVPAA